MRVPTGTHDDSNSNKIYSRKKIWATIRASIKKIRASNSGIHSGIDCCPNFEVTVLPDKCCPDCCPNFEVTVLLLATRVPQTVYKLWYGVLDSCSQSHSIQNTQTQSRINQQTTRSPDHQTTTPSFWAVTTLSMHSHAGMSRTTRPPMPKPCPTLIAVS